MTALGIDIDLTVDYLEDTYADDCRCESAHTHPRCLTCTVEVSHRAIFCTGELLVCSGHARFAQESIEDSKTRCADCNQLCADCWQLVPV